MRPPAEASKLYRITCSTQNRSMSRPQAALKKLPVAMEDARWLPARLATAALATRCCCCYCCCHCCRRNATARLLCGVNRRQALQCEKMPAHERRRTTALLPKECKRAADVAQVPLTLCSIRGYCCRKVSEWTWHRYRQHNDEVAVAGKQVIGRGPSTVSTMLHTKLPLQEGK